jgi:hypothetical protein
MMRTNLRLRRTVNGTTTGYFCTQILHYLYALQMNQKIGILIQSPQAEPVF